MVSPSRREFLAFAAGAAAVPMCADAGQVARSSDLVFASIGAIREAIARKQASPVEVLRQFFARIDAINPKLNAFVTLDRDRALARAREAEAAVMKGARLGSLHGVPVSIKDTIETANIRTTAGSPLWRSFVPTADALAVTRLKDAGAIVLGKTNVPEMAMDYRSENVIFGRTNNPWDLTRTPGGSSGGEAAAIAAGCSPAGLGTDLAGSIRVPAHFCGIVGLKPTPGRTPGSGYVPASLASMAMGSVLGPLARRVADISLLLHVLSGFDPQDPASVPLPVRKLSDSEARRTRIAFHTSNGVAPVTSATAAAVERAANELRRVGFSVAEQSPPRLSDAAALWFPFVASAQLSAVRQFYQGQEAQMGPLVARIVEQTGQAPRSASLMDAWFARDRVRGQILEWMEGFPVVLSPVGSVPAFRHDERTFEVGGQTVDAITAFSYCQTFNVLGFPAVVVPVGRSPEGLPIGVQIVARPFRDEEALAVAAALERALGEFGRPQVS